MINYDKLHQPSFGQQTNTYRQYILKAYCYSYRSFIWNYSRQLELQWKENTKLHNLEHYSNLHYKLIKIQNLKLISSCSTVFLSFWIPADSNPVLNVQWIHLPSSQYDRSIAIISSQFVTLQDSLQWLATAPSVLLVISGHLRPIIPRKYRSTKVCNLFVMWADTPHVSHPYSNTDLTLLLNVLILVFGNTVLFSHNGYRAAKIPFAFLIRDFNI
jgi:hypothetical protein